MAREDASAPTPPVTVRLDAHLAYGMCAYVDGMPSALPRGWVEIWAPAGRKQSLAGNYAVLLQSEAQPSFYAVAIQGTQDIRDVMEDFEIVPQPAFPAIAGARISSGSQKGLDDVLALRGPYEDRVVTLQGLLESLPAGTTLLVTGHSLGGNLASVLMPWIAANVPAFGPNHQPIRRLSPNLNAITFAAPTAGNEAFAKFLDDHPERYQAHFNRNDVVSNVWARSGPLQIHNIDSLFPPPGPGPAPQSVRALLIFKIAQMERAKPRVSYQQTRGVIFHFPPGELPDPVPEHPWIWQLGYEHNYAYCRHFLGPDAGCKE
ncbi:MAG TPA: hypothetical protein VGS57_14015 [Thermoanaerobaculia bacterium]|jgi:hypothetical protein|nr:hypothetical protein [Thermoanaerobaculia bacterium]